MALFRRNVQKQPTQNIAGEKEAYQRDVDADYLFANLSQPRSTS